jgi:hypothetical protein
MLFTYVGIYNCAIEDPNLGEIDISLLGREILQQADIRQLIGELGRQPQHLLSQLSDVGPSNRRHGPPRPNV